MGFVKKYRNLLLSIAGGLILWAGWPPHHLFILLFVGFVPFLVIEDNLSKPGVTKPKVRLFLVTYVGFFIWNTLTTYWLYKATLPGSVFAIIANAGIMTVPFILYTSVKNQLGKTVGQFSLIFFWLSIEYIHHQWELAWPWLSLGNGLAMVPSLIQWYDVTGMFGGSLWILLINLAIFRAIKRRQFLMFLDKQKDQHGERHSPTAHLLKHGVILSLLVFVPVIISLVRFNSYSEPEDPVDIVVLQPNIDPYTQKFPDSEDYISVEDQVGRFITMSEKQLTQSTQYLIWPETAIPRLLNEQELHNSHLIQLIRRFLEKYPNLNLVTGIEGFQIKTADTKTAVSRPWPVGDQDLWFDVYNSALQIDSKGEFAVYHKSKLVPGTERMPYPGIFGFLEKFAIDLGGVTGSYGMQDERSVFYSPEGIRVAPVICYESVFGEYLSRYIRNGAELIFIITNDGWWGNTAGHKQHLHYASIRAIETRRSIARSANTGISCFIDQRGNITQPLPYWTGGTIAGVINRNNQMTVYTKFGDVISRVSLLLSAIVILITLVSWLTSRFQYRMSGKI